MLENLILKIEQYNPQADLKSVVKAYSFARDAHEGQYRNSGDVFLYIHLMLP